MYGLLAHSNFGLAQCNPVPTKKGCKYLFLLLQGKNSRVLSTEALSKRRAESLSRAVCRRMCERMFKAGWRKLVFAGEKKRVGQDGEG